MLTVLVIRKKIWKNICIWKTEENKLKIISTYL